MSVSLSTATNTCPVRSFNEWDPLEEVIVGTLDGAVKPPSHITVTRTIPPLAAHLYRLFGGHRYPRIRWTPPVANWMGLSASSNQKASLSKDQILLISR